jgi:hypothetical protein
LVNAACVAYKKTQGSWEVAETIIAHQTGPPTELRASLATKVSFGNYELLTLERYGCF